MISKLLLLLVFALIGSVQASNKKIDEFIKNYEQEHGKASFIVMESQTGFIQHIHRPEMAITHKYPPGSLMKVLVAMKEYNNRAVTHTCRGRFHLNKSEVLFSDRKKFNLQNSKDGFEFMCSLKKGHGEIDLEHAVIHSCNDYFLRISRGFKHAYLSELYQKFALGKVTNYVPSEHISEIEFPGKLPTKISKLEKMSSIIGEGANIKVSLLKVAQVFSAIWNEGPLLRPSFDKKKTFIEAYPLNFNSRSFRFVKKAMRQVIKRGTLKSLEVENPNIDLIGAKTGTATLENKLFATHAWNVINFNNKGKNYLLVSFVLRGRSMKEGLLLSKGLLNVL